MADARQAEKQANQIAVLIGRLILGISLVVFGATNFFLNVMTFNQEFGTLFPAEPAAGVARETTWTLITWAMLVLVFGIVPFLLGVGLVMKTTAAPAGAKTTSPDRSAS